MVPRAGLGRAQARDVGREFGTPHVFSHSVFPQGVKCKALQPRTSLLHR